MGMAEMLYNAVYYTLQGVVEFKDRDNVYIFNEITPDEQGKWGVSIEVGGASSEHPVGIAYRFQGDGKNNIKVTRSVGPWDNDLAMADEELVIHLKGITSVRQASQSVVAVILGYSVIPVNTRKTMRRIKENAVKDASYHYRLGVEAMLSDPSLAEGWAEADDADRWTLVMRAATQVKGYPTGSYLFMQNWREMGVAFEAMDIYDEEYRDQAVKLMHTNHRGES